MKMWMYFGWFCLLFTSCIREKYRGEDCSAELYFRMKDVPYVFEGDQAVDYRPYYTFTEMLDMFLFSEEKLSASFHFDYDYCREHPVIPVSLAIAPQYYLFASNLYDPKELQWTFVDGELKAWFSILNYEEPPVLLAATGGIASRKDSADVELRMLVSRLEIRVVNPPAWIRGLQLTVRNIAATVATDYSLGDTTHIQKYIALDNQGAGTYEFGVNTFPTYQDKTAVVAIDFIGASQTAPILVDDNRMHLLPGVITRLNIVFDTENKIVLSIEIDGKWEIVDGGSIII